ncbi:MAG TPA: hypothetical protein VMB82_00075 [Acidimicrobiales bacterium]|nr:hypothetical protein [Acidimicrobiales bacterium]
MPAPVRSLSPGAVPTGPGFDVVLLLHVVAAIVALGSVVASGVQSTRLLAAGDGEVPSGVTVYFAPGVNWVGRTLHAVPLLGLALVGLSHGAYGFEDGWIEWGIGLWVAAAVGAEAVLWPAERRVQAGLAASGDGHDLGQVHAAGVRSETARSARTTAVAAGALTAVLVAAVVVMVAQP